MKTIYRKLLFLVLLLPFCAMAQNKVEGTVVDNVSGQPIPGVNVKIEGSSTGASTGFDGKFQLSNVKPTDVLSISYMGYATRTIAVGSQTSLTIKLQEDSNQLKEVVVQVGYGTVKKKDATGTISVLGTKDFNKGPVVSADAMITGRVAGMQVINGGGSPGESAVIRIRGGSSLTASNDPLYVIDGVPTQAGGVQGGRNPLSTINQNNIESISVLKDASATAIYGSRASNGVVIITTKKGKTGDIKVSYNGVFQVSQISNKVDVLSTDEFKSVVDQYGTPAQKALVGTSSTDWQDQIYRTAFGTDNNIAVGGGVDNVTYRASVGYANLQGILLRDNLQRTTFQAGLVGNFFDKQLRVEINNNTASLVNNYSNRGAIGAAVGYDPTRPVKNDDGTYSQWYNANGTYQILTLRNPVSLIQQNNNYGTSFRSIGNAQIDYKPNFIPGLKATANFGIDNNDGVGYGDNSLDFLNGQTGTGYGNTYEHTQNSYNKLMDLYANYNSTIGAVDGVYDVTAGYSYQNFRNTNSGFAYNYEQNKYTYDLENPNTVNLQSFFARGNFTFANKYLVTASYRLDGTSRFTPDNRWSGFPAVALGWKVNEEGFLKDVESVSTLKLRLSWGITGQQDLPGKYYPSLPLYQSSDTASQYPLGGAYYSTLRPQAYNSDLKWEETTSWNAGIDFGFFQNRFTGSVDVYQKDTKDLLLNTQNPSFFGFSNYGDYNVGAMTNKGIEVALSADIIKNDDWNWNLGGNITFQNSEITALTTDSANTPGIAVGGISGGTGNTIQNHQVGYAPNAFFVYEQAYGADGKPLDGVVIDRNQDGKIDDLDKYRYHKPAADAFYGVNTSVSYKNWLLAMNFRGSWGNFNYNNVDSNAGTVKTVLISPSYINNGMNNLLETGFLQTSDRQYLSDYYVQKADFFRMDNVSLGYTFDQKDDKGAIIQLTGAVQNVFVVTEYTGLDPEVVNPGNSVGIDNNIYPRPITFTLGLNVNF
ncbi:SusC/RagA family TonB-linked outer membrane protein [Flavobacterium sp. N3904]|uniref:SusC/RagA family TonB-linked outer membrane protein n=1 Tax=Flavobacterium sp. N3904 TaxID=2986835 RepID=UPI0022249E72|nr:SusC/RagA family TonB-linked outer membrane protein [Flavobacterium sp. N3904]